MKNIPTAKEFLQIYAKNNPEGKYDLCMIEFAKLHVEAQAKEIVKKDEIINDPNSYCGNTGSEYPPDQIVSKNSILNAYSLTNIK